MEQRWMKTICGLSMAAILLVGCGAKRITTSEGPSPANSPAAPAKSRLVANPMTHYHVRKHDTLWAIAGKSQFYNDPFQWPLIFKTNRDVIQDPDLIYPKQDFKIVQGVDALQVQKARELAMRTPKYVPHTKPRETQIFQYF